MKTITIVLAFSSSIFILSINPSHCISNTCEPDSCHGPNSPPVRFPFRITNRQPAHCGYPGFDLYCNSHNQTILNLTNSGEFIIDYIDYTRQALLISDPDSCLPNRILNFTFSGSPFHGENMRDYTFLNCSSSWTVFTSTHFMTLFCLSNSNYTILAMNSHSSRIHQMPATCRRIADVSIPMQWAVSMYYWSSMDLREDFAIFWREPDCRDCESRAGVCGYLRGSGPEIGCSGISRTSLSKSAKYGIIIGVGLPGLIFIIGLISYTNHKIRTSRLQRDSNSSLPITTVSDHQLAIRSSCGLDEPTIESYPKMVLGESGRLPKPYDEFCPICLSDYKPKETLRSIPECNHYFHADCIDEWLKLNITCPLCRQSPPESSACLSMLLSSSSSPRLNDH